MLSLLRPVRRPSAFSTLAVPSPTFRAGLLLGLAFACASCDTTRRMHFAPNQPPTVTLTSGPVDTVSAPQSWLVDIAWTGHDPDGSIDHFEYAIDPPTLKKAMLAQAETAWVSTRENHVVARFHASHADSLGPGATASEFHVFVLRAIDDGGASSPLVVRAFYAYTIAPDVEITRPAPNRLLPAQLPPGFRVEWQGHDPDGEGDGRPVAYRVRLLDLYDYSNHAYLTDPDSLLREGAADNWAGWDRISADTTSLAIKSGLVPGSSLALAVLAVDEAGATTPYLLLDRNFLQFYVQPPNQAGPRIHIWSPYVDYTYPVGGFSLDPSREIPIEVPAFQSLQFRWDGTAATERQVVASRWMVDGNPGDSLDVHWSEWLPPGASATLPPLMPGVHRLYVELKDDFGDLSLAIVRITAIAIDPTHDLLVVNDTRMEVDRFVNDPSHQTPDNYTRPWPSAAELDTFLFARGGFIWRGTKNPTTGVISTPGLLSGYAFDTLGTRLGLEAAANGVRLSTLARYRHVLWLVDIGGATFTPDLEQNLFPVTALRDMSAPGRASALAAYIQTGGDVWLAGGGAAYASLTEFDRRLNNVTQTTVFTARDGELGPGRPMYDAAHVRSALGVTKTGAEPVRSAAARGGWSGQGPHRTLSAPDYTHAPVSLSFRTEATDPIPPTRLASQAGLFYVVTGGTEYVLEPNEVTEAPDGPSPPHPVASTLDTVYEANSTQLLIQAAPDMLYYHGFENAPFVFSGFDIWSWRRADCQGLVDFVLGDIWKLQKSGARAAVRSGVAASMRSPRPPRAMPARPLDPHRMRP